MSFRGSLLLSAAALVAAAFAGGFAIGYGTLPTWAVILEIVILVSGFAAWAVILTRWHRDQDLYAAWTRHWQAETTRILTHYRDVTLPAHTLQRPFDQEAE